MSTTTRSLVATRFAGIVLRYRRMPDAPPTPQRMRLALSPRAVGLIVLTVAGVTALLAVTRASVRVLGWMLVAAAVASLIEPLVDRLAKRMRRGIAIALSMFLLLATAGTIAYFTITEVVHQAEVLQEAAPKRAAALERSERFGATARAFRLAEKTETAVNEIPQRLRGGSSADALRSAGTRGVAYLATTVLTLFLVVNGRKIVSAGIRQIRNPLLQTQVRDALRQGGERGVRYAVGSLAMAATAGLFVGGVAHIVDVPGAVPLGLWAALWDLVPFLGAVIGGLPVVILATAASPATGAAVLSLFIAYQVFEAVFLQRRVEAESLRVGPFLTLAVGSVGLELYGLGGALIALFLTSVALGTLDAWRSAEPVA